MKSIGVDVKWTNIYIHEKPMKIKRTEKMDDSLEKNDSAQSQRFKIARWVIGSALVIIISSFGIRFWQRN